MRKCPFCGKEANFSDVYLHQFSDDKTWCFNHYCDHEPGKLGVTITIYGDSREEVLAKWEGDYYAKEQESESV